MIEIKNKKDCSGCSACSLKCPQHAIIMVEDEEGFEYPVIDKEKCNNCGLCEKICPCITGTKDNSDYKNSKIMAAWSLDDKNREESSSGGCFKEFSEYIIENDGIVIGAGYDQEFNVIHKVVSKKEDLILLKGSKYVQSKIGDTYKIAKENLDENKYVLFVGTPCQIAGLYNFLLNKQYEKLYTCDLICHGVPSRKVYRKYLKEKKDLYGDKIKNVSFRDKTEGWKVFSMKIDFDNGKTYRKNLKNDPYMLGFLQNVYLRPSCYDCKFSRLPRIADITLGDYWGVNNRYNNLDDDKGTSELVINSLKGEELLQKVMKNLNINETDFKFGLSINPCLNGSVKENKKRKDFFNDLDKLPFDKLSKKYFPKTSIYKKAYYKVRSIGGKIKRKITKN